MAPFRTLLAVSASTLAALGLASAETRTFDVEGFEGIRSTAGVDVNVEVGGDYSVTLETEADADEARVEKKGDVLVLGRSSGGGLNFRFGRGQTFTYTVTMPSLKSGTAAAGSDLRITGIDARNLELQTSSGSDLRASGTCGSLRAEASSGSDLKAFEVTCENVRARASSGAEAEVTATVSIDAKASSGGDVHVRGKPESRNTSESSGGDVSIRG